MLLNVTMKFPFISSRRNRERQDRENRPRTVQISVPSELVMDLLTKGAILQVKIGLVPLRPNLTRPERPESTNPRPEAETVNIRPNADEHPRPNPAGRSDIDPPRPERPQSKCQTNRPVSPFIDWSSLSDNEVISVDSEEDDYVPKSPEYTPDSPVPVVESEDQNPGPNNNCESGPSRTVFSNNNEDRPRSPLGRGNLLQGVPPF